MATDRQLDELISSWLEETAPAQLPERVLDSTFERTRRSRQHVGWRALLWRFQINRFVPALGAVTAVVVAAALGLGLYANQRGFGGPAVPTLLPAESNTPAPADTPAPSDGEAVTLAGGWVATDLDGSHQTMELIALANGNYDVTISDDLAGVCDGVPSTMTGVAEAAEPDTLVIAQPSYVCDDGSEPEVLSGPPLEDQLKDLSFVYDFQRDALHDSLGLVWKRVERAPGDGETRPTATPPSAADGEPLAAAFPGFWEATDNPPDRSHQVMEAVPLPGGTYGVTIRDDVATVCGGAASTMTGVARQKASGTLVIEQPVYVCDDGSEPEELSGPPLEEQLSDLSFVYDSVRDALFDSLGLEWTRVEVAP